MTINTPINNDGNELRFGCINVCGLKRRLNYPEFYDTLSQLDILCVTETKLDHLDVINIPGMVSFRKYGNKSPYAAQEELQLSIKIYLMEN